MSTDPRTITAAVQRVMLMRARFCAVREAQRNMFVPTGESWISREPCGDLATYATVKNGRVSPRCERHAKRDAANMGVEINENQMIEARRACVKPKKLKPQRPDPANPLNGIGCLTHAAAKMFGS